MGGAIECLVFLSRISRIAYLTCADVPIARNTGFCCGTGFGAFGASGIVVGATSGLGGSAMMGERDGYGVSRCCMNASAIQEHLQLNAF